MPRFLAAVSAAALVSLPLSAFTLGPELPSSPAFIAPAPYAQLSPSAASNGLDFVVTWLDHRSSHGSAYSIPVALYAAHVDATGEVTPPAGRKLDYAYSAAVASNGSGFVVAYPCAPIAIQCATRR